MQGTCAILFFIILRVMLSEHWPIFMVFPFLQSSTVQDVHFLAKSSGDCVQNIFCGIKL